MPIIYKFDILAALREKGYNTNYIRKNKLIAESALQHLRNEQPVSFSTLETICRLLEIQPGDVLEYAPEEE